MQGHLYCIDWSDESLEIFGNEATGNVAYIEISAVPCNLKLSLESIGGDEDRIGSECRWDFDDLIQYIRPPNLLFYYNKETIDTEKYGEEKLIQKSYFSSLQFDEMKPNWVPVYVNRDMLIDSTEYLNTNPQGDELQFNSVSIGKLNPSAWTTYPTAENPNGRYKLSGFTIYVSQDMHVTER